MDTVDTSVLISEQEYLDTSYDPDCELVDGHLLERNVGERPHSILQGELIFFFGTRRKQLGVRAFPEQRVWVAPRRYRIPDVCVYREPAPRDPVFSTPPFIAIEILSPRDRMSRMRVKIDDYLRFGVQYVWIIDPETHRADVYTASGFYEAKELILRTEDPRIELPLGEMFQALDE
jgi:Uma2 family endonuclease